jgi:hypothetical protein
VHDYLRKKMKKRLSNHVIPKAGGAFFRSHGTSEEHFVNCAKVNINEWDWKGDSAWKDVMRHGVLPFLSRDLKN